MTTSTNFRVMLKFSHLLTRHGWNQGALLFITCRKLHKKVPKTRDSWAAMSGKGNIFLMGKPGCGKTTTGKILGAALGRSVLDIDDHLLTPVWGMSIAEKLKREGEEVFLEEEGKALLGLEVENAVVSLTGSNPLHGESMSKISQMGVLIYLDATNDTILKRQKAMKVDRIIGMTAGATLKEVLKYRGQFYEKWYDIRVLVHINDTDEQVAERVLKAVRRFENDTGYISTRASTRAQNVNFLDVVLQGLAPDGGLYVKSKARPKFSFRDIHRLVPLDFRERALRLLEAWIHPLDISPQELKTFINKSYTIDLFKHPDLAPVFHLRGKLFTQELFHGPTASFKDWALQLMPRFFIKAMKQADPDHKYLILTATSGDTGSATLDGFNRHAGGAKVGVMVLYPTNNISEIQKRQTTTLEGNNLKVIGVDDDFDFCQKTVKRLFGDPRVKDNLGNCRLSAANSMNWGRLLPQVLYHATAYLDLVKDGYIKPGDAVDFCIPTGNFGNILSAFYVKEMGFPIRKLICASNGNNILTEFMHSGIYAPASYTLQRTISPSIDIIRSSNLERLLFHLADEDASVVNSFYADVAKTGRAEASEEIMAGLKQHFIAGFATEENTNEALLHVFSRTGYLMDPHTAVGLYVAKQYGDQMTATVVSGTAHYAKFVDNIMPLLEPSENHSSLSVSQLMDRAANLTVVPQMNKFLTSMVSKKIVHTDTTPADYDKISQMVVDFAKQL